MDPATQTSSIQGMEMFHVDVAGLRRKFANRSKTFLVYELYQNAVDEDVSRVSMTLEPVDGYPLYRRMTVEDDSPEGFKNLAHSYTLYADSTKLHNPEQRGIWNLGEKLVLAFCTSAQISSTKGTVIFKDGKRFHSDLCRPRGTRFEGLIRMTADEFDECRIGMSRLIPPEDIEVKFNRAPLSAPPRVHEFETTLPTTIGDDAGAIRRTRRKTNVRIYQPFEGEPGMIYEMGIPVVETGDRWHYDVQQRVPLNMLRDNVTPAYLQELRVVVLNEMHNRMEEDDANQKWARAASDDRRCSDHAIASVLDLRFGKRRVSYDPSDQEANRQAVAEGYTIVHGGHLSKTEWSRAKEAEAIRPAGQVTPTYRAWEELEHRDIGLNRVPEERYTPGILRVRTYLREISSALIGREVEMEIVIEPHAATLATYERSKPLITFNVGRLGYKWFDDQSPAGQEKINALIIHELGHEYESNHLARGYYDALCDLGARLTQLALERPGIFHGMV